VERYGAIFDWQSAPMNDSQRYPVGKARHPAIFSDIRLAKRYPASDIQRHSVTFSDMQRYSAIWSDIQLAKRDIERQPTISGWQSMAFPGTFSDIQRHSAIWSDIRLAKRDIERQPTISGWQSMASSDVQRYSTIFSKRHSATFRDIQRRSPSKALLRRAP